MRPHQILDVVILECGLLPIKRLCKATAIHHYEVPQCLETSD
ncbi:unnamed protein product [Ciceribacter sp. T2.26MG-112.2]|nr:unnamed protein product [Ciceribacter naphthalenivorans]